MRYAKRGRLRFASHRDIARALERALRRAEVPVAFSVGFSPHPKLSYTGAAPTGVASEAEYFELTLAEPADPDGVRARLDDAMPDGIDIVEVVPATAPGGLADRLEASEWRVEMPGVAPGDAEAAVAVFLAADTIEVERLTRKGRRRFDAREAVLSMESDGRAPSEREATYAILRMVVRHTTPAVRPDDVVTGLRQVAGLAPPSSMLMTRLAQGPLDETTGTIGDPFAVDSAADRDAGRVAERPGEGAALSAPAARVPEAPSPSLPTRSAPRA